MTNEEAEEKFDLIGHQIEEEFGEDCLFIIVALTDDQTRTHYISNIERSDAVHLIGDLKDMMEEDSSSRGKPH
jgi:hypothetical protein